VAGGLRQLLGFYDWCWSGFHNRRGSSCLNDWSGSYGFRGRRSDHDRFGYGHFFLLRSFSNYGNHFDVSVGSECGNWFFHDYSQFDGSLLRINKFLTEVIAGIEPSLESFRVVARALCELDNGVAGWFEAIVVDRQDGGDDL
jgi:hypothetical protein